MILHEFGHEGVDGSARGSEALEHVGAVLVFVEAAKHAFELSDDFFRPINQIQLFSRKVRHFTRLPYRGIVSDRSLETKESGCNTSVMSLPNT